MIPCVNLSIVFNVMIDYFCFKVNTKIKIIFDLFCFRVKLILKKSPVILYYILGRKDFMKFLSELALYSGIFSVIILVLLACLAFFAFDTMFILFHKLLFTGNYAFDPAFSNMKTLFPDGFFFDIGTAIILTTFIKSVLLAAFGYFLNKQANK